MALEMWAVSTLLLFSYVLASGESATTREVSPTTSVIPVEVKPLQVVITPVKEQVIEGCEYVDQIRICATGNITETKLQITCTGTNYPLGAAVNIFLSIFPHSNIYNYKIDPLFEGCSFSELEAVDYTCSFTTDVFQFMPGAKFKCVFNGRYPEHTFYTKRGSTYSLVNTTNSAVKRPTPLLNCDDRFGNPALAWSINVNDKKQGSTADVTTFTPGSLRAFCVLACHNEQYQDWELAWTLNDVVLNGRRIQDMKMVNLSLEYDLVSADNLKILECSLRSRVSNSSWEVLTRINTIVIVNSLEGRKATHEGTLRAQRPEDATVESASNLSIDCSGSSPWWMVGSLITLLLIAAVAAVAFWKRNSEPKVRKAKVYKTPELLLPTERDEPVGAGNP